MVSVKAQKRLIGPIKFLLSVPFSSLFDKSYNEKTEKIYFATI